MYHYGKQLGPPSTLLDSPALELSVRSVQANSPGALLPAFEMLENWMRVFGYPRRDLVAVILATREAVLNAFRHGHRCDRDKTLRLRYLVTPDEALIEVEDEGFGFDTAAVPNALTAWEEQQPRGRGLFLMRSYATWLCFNATGNRVTLCRRRTEV
jgi:anti-sigma regulatory factor (Ser/Thr protein kinase)